MNCDQHQNSRDPIRRLSPGNLGVTIQEDGNGKSLYSTPRKLLRSSALFRTRTRSLIFRRVVSLVVWRPVLSWKSCRHRDARLLVQEASLLRPAREIPDQPIPCRPTRSALHRKWSWPCHKLPRRVRQQNNHQGWL